MGPEKILNGGKWKGSLLVKFSVLCDIHSGSILTVCVNLGKLLEFLCSSVSLSVKWGL